MTLPDDATVERFRAELERLWIEHDGGGNFGVAVSGGPDSVALLLLAHAALPGRVVAATVDHCLRPESEAEAMFVAGLCASRDIPHDTLRVEVASGNMQAQAREARYAALQQAFARRGCHAYATAHHADDQAETMLMRLNRGSGLSGLACIRAHSVRLGEDPPAEMQLVRPLLEWRRGDLADIVRRAGIVPVRDPSNEDGHFDRVRMRRALAEADWIDPVAIARSARFLQDAERIVEDELRRVRRDWVHADGEAIWFVPGHTRLVEVGIVRSIIADLGGQARGGAAARMVDTLHREGVATLGGIVARRGRHPRQADLRADAWKFEREGPRSGGRGAEAVR